MLIPFLDLVVGFETSDAVPFDETRDRGPSQNYSHDVGCYFDPHDEGANDITQITPRKAIDAMCGRTGSSSQLVECVTVMAKPEQPRTHSGRVGQHRLQGREH